MKKSVLFSIFAMFLFAGCAAIQDFCAYKDGVEVSTSQMKQIKVGKSKMSDVERIVGYPSTKQETKRGEIWRYPFTKIRHFGSNVNEITVFEFNKKGVVTKKYKAAGGGRNPLIG